MKDNTVQVQIDFSNLYLLTQEESEYLKSLFPVLKFKQRKRYDEFSVQLTGVTGELTVELSVQDILDLSKFFEVSVYQATIRLSN